MTDEDLLARRVRRGHSNAVRDILAAASAPGVLSMAGGLPAPDSFPVAELTEVIDQVMRKVPNSLQYGPVDGVPALREIIAARASASSAPVDPARVLIVSGSQQGLDLVARVLLDEGDSVALDDPSYVGAIETFRQAGAELAPVPSDEDGMETQVLAEQLRRGLRPKLVYVVPHFHNPSGAVLSEQRRRHLAELADRYGFLIVEDDPYADLSFDGVRLPSAAVHTGRVVRLLSLSKTLCPGFRVAGMVAPAWLGPRLTAVKQCADVQTNTFGQYVVAGLLSRPGFLEKHVAGLATLYRTRAERLSALVAERVPGLSFTPPRGGLYFWCTILDQALDAETFTTAALANGVAVVPGSPFCIERDGSRYLRLSYATLSPAETVAAVDRLALTFERGATRPVAVGGPA
ncbi:PLP-dependent aminotransferase family protein [Micromonospora orduensis]|uniref:PLP-dependent aminotransferase family protein n=1 Tax=Micromonospora orduensis TaxID=1420891 RepID=A0A5C4QA76_9ACTN|nr:PLP-dependent aminotransferase family protein [Micromonospora orduensis]TNH22703.1 PLP-dependent aminotransferase family protein [Micromonospora orduensis]